MHGRVRPEILRAPLICRLPFATGPAICPWMLHVQTSRPLATLLTEAPSSVKLPPLNGTVLRPVTSNASRPHRTEVSKRTAIWPPRGCSEMPTVGS